MARNTMVTLGTDGAVNYVQAPDGQRYSLGPVSVLSLISNLVPSGRVAKNALDEFLSKNQVMVKVDMDEMWRMLPYRRARFSSVDAGKWKVQMKQASYDSFSQNIETAEGILNRVASTNSTIDRLVTAGKRFDSTRAKGDLLKIASKVEAMVQEIDLAEPWVAKDLGELSKQAEEICGLFPDAE